MPPDTSSAAAVLFTGPGERLRAPGWARERYRPTVVGGEELRQLRHLSEITVVCSRSFSALKAQGVFLRMLATKQSETPGPAKVLFVFSGSPPRHAEEFATLLSHFARQSDVEFARDPEEAVFAVEEARGKILAAGEPAPSPPPRQDLLGGVREVVAATRDLRSGSGRLSARRVAELFGLSLSEVARLLGRNKQTVAKTEDAEALQPGLRTFERVTRLRALLSDDDFRRWLNLPSWQLGDEAPIALVKKGQIEIVADLAENMLLGSPT